MKRREEFLEFSMIVLDHVKNYTIAQYGEKPNDQVEEWTPKQCMDSIKRYANRIDSNQRGHLESLRDMAKIAHYAAIAFYKLKPSTEEIQRIKKGV